MKLLYGNAWLCDSHFVEYLKDKVKDNIVKYGMAKRGDKVLLAVSGGKDSITLMKLLDDVSPELGIEVIAVHIILGMGEFSDLSLKAFRAACSQAKNVKCIEVDLKQLLGMYMPEIIRRSGRPACSVCGLVKRYVLNAIAASLGASSIATGHHMNDLMTYAIKNFMEQRLADIRKLGPVSDSEGPAIKRIRPLYDVYEDETRAFVRLTGSEYVDIECPFKTKSTIESVIKDYLNKLEANSPSMTISAARLLARNLKVYPKDRPSLSTCKVCGMPSSGDVCGFCKLTSRLFGKPMGPEVRQRLSSTLATSSVGTTR